MNTAPVARLVLALTAVLLVGNATPALAESGRVATLAEVAGGTGGQDGSRLEASFCYPNDIAASRDGKTLYVNEVADHASDGMKLAPTRVRAIHR